LTTSHATIAILDELFAAYGTPVTVVSDNGTQFTSAEFTAFLQSSGVKHHKLSAPYHPATNGQAERYVQTTKDALNKMNTTSSTLREDLNVFLKQYRKSSTLNNRTATRKTLLRTPDSYPSRPRETRIIQANGQKSTTTRMEINAAHIPTITKSVFPVRQHANGQVDSRGNYHTLRNASL